MPPKKSSAAKKQVRSITTETYEEPLDDAIDVEATEVVEPVNPIAEFLRSIDENRPLMMKVYVLPNYYKDGKTSLRGTERPFLTQFSFSSIDVEDYQQRIQACYPSGGMFALELREPGTIGVIRSWTESIAPAPGYQPSSQQPQHNSPFPIIVNPPQQQQAQVNPVEVMKEHMTLAKDLVGMAKDLMPPLPVPENGENGHKPFEQTMLEALLLGAAQSGDKGTIKEALEVFSGHSATKPSWMEMAAPALFELVKYVGPGIQSWLQAQTLAQQARAQQIAATLPAGHQLPAAQTGPVPTPPEPPPPDPAEKAWRTAIDRTCADLVEHCAIRKVSATDGINPSPDAGMIADLLDRFPDNEQMILVVKGFLDSEPDEVLRQVVVFFPNSQAQQILLGLVGNKDAAEWIGDLQKEAREIIQDFGHPEEPEPEVEPKPSKRPKEPPKEAGYNPY